MQEQIEIESKCLNPKCDNYITVNYTKEKGGLKDKAILYYECDKCGDKNGYTAINNPETITIKGGKKIRVDYND